MDWRDLGKKLGSLAPATGRALAGPGGALAGAAVAHALGVSPTPDAVEAALQSDPTARQELQKREIAFAEALLIDTQHARETHQGHWMTWLLPLILVPATLAYGAALFFATVPDGNRDIAFTIFGALIAWAGDSVRFWIGSSRGSSEKTGLLRGPR